MSDSETEKNSCDSCKVALAQILNELRTANIYLELISRSELRYTQEALRIEANMQERAKRRATNKDGA
jgi:hypothetical protein